jgi:hypothetical protein
MLLTRARGIKPANGYKILVQSILKMPLRLIRWILIWAPLTKLLLMPARTLLARNSTSMQVL